MMPEVRDCQSSDLTTIYIPTNIIVVSLWYFISYSVEENRGPQKGKLWMKQPSPRETILTIIVRYLTRSMDLIWFDFSEKAAGLPAKQLLLLY